MAHDCWVGSYYLNSSGAWTTNVPTYTGNTGGSTASSTEDNKSQTVYVTEYGNKYHSKPNCGNSKTSRPTTLEKAQKAGLGRCGKCW